MRVKVANWDTFHGVLELFDESRHPITRVKTHVPIENYFLDDFFHIFHTTNVGEEEPKQVKSSHEDKVVTPATVQKKLVPEVTMTYYIKI